METKNKTKAEYQNENIICDCGLTLKRYCLRSHLTTDSHKKYLSCPQENPKNSNNKKINENHTNNKHDLSNYIICNCGDIVFKNKLTQHLETETHKNKLKSLSPKILCECGKFIKEHRLLEHLKTYTHKKKIKKII
jgi:hypothetical protein